MKENDCDDEVGKCIETEKDAKLAKTINKVKTCNFVYFRKGKER